MRRIVDRYGPTSPVGQLTVAGFSGAVGLGALFMAVGWTYAEEITPFIVLAIGLCFSAVAQYEASAVLSRAEAAPEPRRREDAATDDRNSVPETDPVDVLKRRYAEGELSTEEFEDRIARLVDQDVTSRDAPADEVDQELERA